MSPDGQPDIYLYDVTTGIKNKITKYSGIDVSGNFIDDEKRVAFISDRLGYPNIFAKSIPRKGESLTKRGVEQLVYHGGNNNSCSAYGNYIVYTSRESENGFKDNLFNLYLISTQSDYIRRLTTIGVNQFPKFSNNGESIIHINRYKKESALGIIRLNYNKSFLFPLNVGKIQSIDW
jgi:TolB protein